LRRCYKAWSGEENGKQLFVDVNGPELLSGIEGVTEARFRRSAICEVVENESTLLLFLNKKKFLYFSKGVVPSAAFDEIHEWLVLPGSRPLC
jgi:hypothetical protein